jgi:hypothetical protein
MNNSQPFAQYLGNSAYIVGSRSYDNLEDAMLDADNREVDGFEVQIRNWRPRAAIDDHYRVYFCKSRK